MGEDLMGCTLQQNRRESRKFDPDRIETQYTSEMTTSEGVKLAVKAVNTALQRDSCSGNGVNVVVITTKDIKNVMSKEVTTSLY